MNLKKRRLGVALACAALLAAGCGDDDDDEVGGSAEPTDNGGGAVEFTISRDGIDGPSEIEGGTIEVTVTDQSGGTEMELDFVRVEEGTSEDEFRDAMATVFDGGEIDDILLDVAGLTLPVGGTTATETVTLPAGEYFVFTELDDPAENEREGADKTDTTGAGDTETTEDGAGEEEAEEDPLANFVAKTLRVSEGDEIEVPESDGGTIVASDYTFDTSGLEPGTNFTFTNDGPDELHHAVLMNFGNLDPETVEEHFPAFLESEGEDAPPEFEGLDEEELFGLGASGVFSPGLSGTFTSDLDAGTTYVAVCFIQDRAGGPPHAIAHDMWSVFTVDG